MKSLKVVTVPVTPLQQNCSVLADLERKEAVIVDPGGDVPQIQAAIETLGVTVTGVWLTHSHFDHCGGVAAALRCWKGVPLLGHPGEALFRARVPEIAQMWGLNGFEACPEPTKMLTGGESLRVGSHSCAVLFVPGHSPGHLAFYFADDHALIAGDTLFQRSIGRTDLPGGDHEQLLASIKREILTLPDDVLVFPGHGPQTKVGDERRSNQYLV